MGKTLVVAEKPSVGRDIAAALPGTFKASSDKSHLVGDDYVITWTIGHLVGLADPEVYDPKLKKWRYADLPIVPSKFKLTPNDAKAEKQLKAIHRLMRSDEVDVIVEARFGAEKGEYAGRYMGGKRLKAEADATKIVDACRDQPGTITGLEKKEEREQPFLLYDLTTLQRHANTLFGFSARRTLNAAQALYERHKALTYPRTNSKFLSGDLVAEIKPTAAHVGHNEPYRKSAEYVTSLERLPLQRVVNDARVTDHHAIIPTNSEHNLGKMSDDERRIYDLVTKRFLAVFHPD